MPPPFTASELGFGHLQHGSGPSEETAQVITESWPLTLVLWGPFWGPRGDGLGDPVQINKQETGRR